YHQNPEVLPVAWSLEVEVQFYILAPLFCLIFLIRSGIIRRTILLAIIIGNIFYWYGNPHMGNVIKFSHLFCCGILLADLYCNHVLLFKNQKVGLAVGIAALIGLFFVDSL